MLEPGDKVLLTYYESDGIVTSGGWTVIEYDDGLLKAYQSQQRVYEDKEIAIEKTVSKPTIFNMHSTGFLKAEVV